MERILNTDVLFVTRTLEWLDLALSFDQQNRYVIQDKNGNRLGFVVEEGGIAKAITRQYLGRLRPFTAHVLGLDGRVLMSVSRGFTLINTSMKVSDSQGQDIGLVQQVFHPIRRKYELYDQSRQFADIDEGFLSWSFNLMDENGGLLALVSRNWSGIGTEVFTDAGLYALVFEGLANQKSMPMDQRIIALGCAITIDLDYFTR